MKFPELGLEENWDALQLLIEDKFEEIRSAVLEAHECNAQLDHIEREYRRQAYNKLEALGVIPEELPF